MNATAAHSQAPQPQAPQPQAPQPEVEASDTAPRRYDQLKRCDIVMKGGITSGIVYPSAVHVLAKSYRFMNIGGTSSGAIAAAATAAAELHRFETQRTDSFDELEKLAEELAVTGGKSRRSMLFRLFQPQARTKPLFETSVAFLGDRLTWSRRMLNGTLAAMQNFWLATLTGLVPGLAILLYVLLRWAGTAADGAMLLMALAICSVGGLLAVVTAFAVTALRALQANNYGFCTGMPAASGEDAPALAEWMADYFDRRAGVTDSARPLTFGDLRWGFDRDQSQAQADGTPDPAHSPAIHLNMITTCLTLGRPYSLPLKQPSTFYYDPVELARYFPQRVIDWMVNCPSTRELMSSGRTLYSFPEADDMPVVVATRMSISFPILLSAIPLYMVDYSLTRNQGGGAAKAEAQGDYIPPGCDPTQAVCPERVWFSDGGIAINFPISFFDRMLPRWVTFGINLRTPHPDYPIVACEAQNVWMPEENDEGDEPAWTRFERPSSPAGSLLGFFGSILYTARTWMDHTHMMTPGYRDRIVHVSIGDSEGGLNLTMPKESIESLEARGRVAGELLAKHFTAKADDVTISWDNHRWTRYRSAMALLEEMLEGVQASYGQALDGEREYADLIERPSGSAPEGYPFVNKTQQEYAKKATDALLALAVEWERLRQSAKQADTTGDEDGEDTYLFRDRHAPQPAPEFQIRPRI